MKRLAALLLCFSASASAGTFDGIYSCGVAFSGQTVQSYVSVNEHADGRAIFTVPLVSIPTGYFFYGYGIGQVSGSNFSGLTETGRPFSLTRTASGAVGTVQLSTGQTASASCVQIW